MKAIYPIFLGALLSACSSSPVVEPLVSELEPSRGMNIVSKTRFDEFYFKKSTDLSEYHSLWFSPLDFENLVIDESRLNFRDKGWQFDDQDIERIQRIYNKQVMYELERNEVFKLADGPGEGVLAVRFELIEFAPNAAKDDSINRGVRDKIYTRGFGALEVVARISDSQSGLPIALANDREEVQSLDELERNDRFNNTRLLKLELRSWISSLTSTFEALRKSET